GRKTLQGTQIVTWTHPGSKPVQELVFHLYPNAFASRDTTFHRESGGALRGDRKKDSSVGGMDITSIQTSDGASLNGRLQYVQPDDGNLNDRTLAVLRLEQPVQPGEAVTLHLDFTVRLPEVYARMGYHGDFIMAGQWFPKLAAYETGSTNGKGEEGWNMHQYHGNSEFYADFGIYSVQINVPETYIIAATGFPTGPAAVKDGRKTVTYYADDVHDFAWAASPDFILVEEPYAADQVPGVRIKL